MSKTVAILLISAALWITACKSSTNQPAATNQPMPAAQSAASSPQSTAPTVPGATPAAPLTAKAKLDACTLLTSDEIKAVQGEPVKETKASDRATGEFIVTQCYYELPTASNSISLTLTESNSVKKDDLKEYWERTFGKDENKSESERRKDREEEKKKERASSESRREGEEEEAPLEPVRGVGDEAFWSASRVGGALYVLKSDRYLRISVGGKGDVEAKLKKSKALAQKALRRL
jgi:hypothetical protein